MSRPRAKTAKETGLKLIPSRATADEIENLLRSPNRCVELSLDDLSDKMKALWKKYYDWEESIRSEYCMKDGERILELSETLKLYFAGNNLEDEDDDDNWRLFDSSFAEQLNSDIFREACTGAKIFQAARLSGRLYPNFLYPDGNVFNNTMPNATFHWPTLFDCSPDSAEMLKLISIRERDVLPSELASTGCSGLSQRIYESVTAAFAPNAAAVPMNAEASSADDDDAVEDDVDEVAEAPEPIQLATCQEPRAEQRPQRKRRARRRRSPSSSRKRMLLDMEIELTKRKIVEIDIKNLVCLKEEGLLYEEVVQDAIDTLMAQEPYKTLISQDE